jgi:hypothetical protein
MTLSENICLPKTYLIIILCIIMGSVVWYIHMDKKKHLNESDYKYNDTMINKIIKTITTQNSDEQKNINKIIKKLDELQPSLATKPLYFIDNNESNDMASRKNFLKERDAKVLYDDLSPPERRVPEHQYPTATIKKMINIPTRGLPDDYQLLGLVLRDNTETVYNLFGRQTFPNSNQYEYYVQATMHNNTVKLPIKVRGDKEIMDHDEISIPGMDKSKGRFTVKLYKFDAPRYNPYL